MYLSGNPERFDIRLFDTNKKVMFHDFTDLKWWDIGYSLSPTMYCESIERYENDTDIQLCHQDTITMACTGVHSMNGADNNNDYLYELDLVKFFDYSKPVGEEESFGVICFCEKSLKFYVKEKADEESLEQFSKKCQFFERYKRYDFTEISIRDCEKIGNILQYEYKDYMDITD